MIRKIKISFLVLMSWVNMEAMEYKNIKNENSCCELCGQCLDGCGDCLCIGSVFHSAMTNCHITLNCLKGNDQLKVGIVHDLKHFCISSILYIGGAGAKVAAHYLRDQHPKSE